MERLSPWPFGVGGELDLIISFTLDGLESTICLQTAPNTKHKPAEAT